MRRALLAVLLCAVPVGAQGATQSVHVAVTAAVLPNCLLRDAAGNALTIACTRGASGVAIALGAGQNADGAYRTVRYVAAGSAPVEIPLYGRVAARNVLLASVDF